MVHNALRASVALAASAVLVGPAPAATPKRSAPLTIIGGDYVQKSQYTATVALRWKLDRSAFCTGTIVADHWILTAEHCVTRSGGAEVPLDRFFISPGRLDRQEPDAIVVERVDYPGKSVDVVLLKSSAKLTSDSVTAAPVAQRTPSSGAVTLVGWGLLGWVNGSPASRLMKLKLDIAACPTGVKDTSFCTQSAAKGATRGDSGGSVYVGTPQNPTLVGVINMGQRPYSIFAKSQTISGWVREKTQ